MSANKKFFLPGINKQLTHYMNPVSYSLTYSYPVTKGATILAVLMVRINTANSTETLLLLTYQPSRY